MSGPRRQGKICMQNDTAMSRDLRIGNFRSNGISNRIGGYDSNSNRIESGVSRLHVQCQLSCGSCVCALATASTATRKVEL